MWKEGKIIKIWFFLTTKHVQHQRNNNTIIGASSAHKHDGRCLLGMSMITFCHAKVVVGLEKYKGLHSSMLILTRWWCYFLGECVRRKKQTDISPDTCTVALHIHIILLTVLCIQPEEVKRGENFFSKLDMRYDDVGANAMGWMMITDSKTLFTSCL